MGIISTDLMNQWLDFYPQLFDMAIIIKKILHEKSMNNNYSGGISSYIVLILIIAYLRETDQIFNKDLTIILSGFLDFYGNKFNPKLKGI